MAVHYPLKQKDEPKLFKLVQDNLTFIYLSYYKAKSFSKVKFESADGKFEVMPLSKDYTEDPEDIAVKFGNVSLESIADEDTCLTQNISVEIHISVVNRNHIIKNIFWVA